MMTIDGREFNLADFEKSETANRNRIGNKLQGYDIADYEFLMDIIVKIQAKFGKPIYVDSGFRSKALNKAVGGVWNSQHRSLGNEAASDISARSQIDNRQLYEVIRGMILTNEIVLDQIIDEKNYKWVHISAKRTGLNRKQFIRL